MCLNCGLIKVFSQPRRLSDLNQIMLCVLCAGSRLGACSLLLLLHFSSSPCSECCSLNFYNSVTLVIEMCDPRSKKKLWLVHNLTHLCTIWGRLATSTPLSKLLTKRLSSMNSTSCVYRFETISVYVRPVLSSSY